MIIISTIDVLIALLMRLIGMWLEYGERSPAISRVRAILNWIVSYHFCAIFFWS